MYPDISPRVCTRVHPRVYSPAHELIDNSPPQEPPKARLSGLIHDDFRAGWRPGEPIPLGCDDGSCEGLVRIINKILVGGVIFGWDQVIRTSSRSFPPDYFPNPPAAEASLAAVYTPKRNLMTVIDGTSMMNEERTQPWYNKSCTVTREMYGRSSACKNAVYDAEESMKNVLRRTSVTSFDRGMDSSIDNPIPSAFSRSLLSMAHRGGLSSRGACGMSDAD